MRGKTLPMGEKRCRGVRDITWGVKDVAEGVPRCRQGVSESVNEG